MKVMTVLGTRPEIIRLSRVIPLLDRFCEHTLVHTGQNYDDRLSRLFFDQLGVRTPDVHLGVKGSSLGEQIGQILAGAEQVIRQRRPDRLLILGDTNSGLVAILARRLGIPVFHMEAGNRCFDDRVPEEVNRRVIDHSSTVLLPYTERSRTNLLREGIATERVLVTGNPIKQVLDAYSEEIGASKALDETGVEPQKYFVVTAHRAENVDREDVLRQIVDALVRIHERWKWPVLCSLHPRTKAKMERFGIGLDQAGVRFLQPLGFFDFVRLEQQAACLLTDSGTVQEEGCILHVPNVTIREVTERPETVECGSNLLAGTKTEAIVGAVEMALAMRPDWPVPPEYLVAHVAEAVVRIVLGHRVADLAEVEWQSGLRS